MAKQRPSRQRILELLDYDRKTGTLRWKMIRGSRARPGDVAGCAAPSRERRLSIDGQMFANAQIVWFLEKGSWNTSSVRHKDGNPLNDQIDNLYLHGVERHGHELGERVYEVAGRWNVEHKFRLIGSYDTEQEANAVMEGIRRALG